MRIRQLYLISYYPQTCVQNTHDTTAGIVRRRAFVHLLRTRARAERSTVCVRADVCRPTRTGSSAGSVHLVATI